LVDEEPVKQIIEGGYSIVIRGQSRDGVYKINLNTDGLYIEKASTEQKRELDYLKMRAPPEVTIAPETEEVFVKKIPKQIRKRVVRSLPSVTN
jgi:hypothetical protein